MLKKYAPSCIFCQSFENITRYIHNKPVCQKCVGHASEVMTEVAATGEGSAQVGER